MEMPYSHTMFVTPRLCLKTMVSMTWRRKDRQARPGEAKSAPSSYILLPGHYCLRRSRPRSSIRVLNTQEPAQHVARLHDSAATGAARMHRCPAALRPRLEEVERTSCQMSQASVVSTG
jgi:hypothetical protein